MIPRLHKRGQSFKGACTYVLHDAEQAKTGNRVVFAHTENMATKAVDWAWHEMTDTYWSQGALKAASGRDQRGRKNTHPVLHFSLSWAHADEPSLEHMKATALSSLKAMGLEEHEALIVGHDDKKHLHVHIIVNTVHPQTGITAPLKYTKLALSRWAEAYEQEHGLHCDERVQNNAERDRTAKNRKRSATELLMKGGDRHGPAKPPYVPVKHRQTTRKQWFAKKEITDRMKQMRAELDKQLKAERDTHWKTQLAERDALDAHTEAALDDLHQRAKEHYKPYWRDLYRAQKRETLYLRKVLAYEAAQKAQRPPSAREALEAAVRPIDPMTDLKREHEAARRAMAQQQREDVKLHTDAIEAAHREAFETLRVRQAEERQAERAASFSQTRKVTFDAAKRSLLDDQRKAAEPRPFKRTPEQRAATKNDDKDALPTLEQRQDRPSERHEAARDFGKAADGSARPASRADQIKRDMAEWRTRNAGKDAEREM